MSRGASWELRTVGPGDVDALMAFWLVAAEQTDRADAREAVARLVAHDADAVILAEDGPGNDRKLVGCVVATSWATGPGTPRDTRRRSTGRAG